MTTAAILWKAFWPVLAGLAVFMALVLLITYTVSRFKGMK